MFVTYASKEEIDYLLKNGWYIQLVESEGVLFKIKNPDDDPLKNSN